MYQSFLSIILIHVCKNVVILYQIKLKLNGTIMNADIKAQNSHILEFPNHIDKIVGNSKYLLILTMESQLHHSYDYNDDQGE